MHCLVGGLLDKSAAWGPGIGPKTVDFQPADILERARIGSTGELAHQAVRGSA